MITAYGAVDTAIRAMKLGADDFLEKPVNLSGFIQKIQEIDERVFVCPSASLEKGRHT
ncbi:MAG: hypothetical protein ACUVQ6_01080 [Dissulfurimicrobium sp.]|uniref:hypothetical protein n=1 Tax=Dissulfurimicrobium sp. TaxID=2022436 RepID=UPI00404B6CE4